ncbi:MAG: putative antibiotic transporter [Syntrophorhabdaceae bacterium PtaU1.Bin034]|jgi:multiple antibiotic resistance protein|nr:MAG: putative antibiotic transporter [Syntrophorhabdaceae bacterium PtaU1.Bin034]
MWEAFLKSFIPIFVALDVLGVLPLYARFSIGLDEKKRKRVLRESIVTAFLVTISFIAIGNEILDYLNISIEDFLIAGGIILFIIAVRDLLGGGREDLVGQDDLFAVVPLGVPLLAGPALLATSLIIFNTFGFIYVLVALVLNLALAGIIFKYSLLILRFISRRWIEAMAKVFILFLASIAIMFIRTGLQGLQVPLK